MYSRLSDRGEDNMVKWEREDQWLGLARYRQRLIIMVPAMPSGRLLETLPATQDLGQGDGWQCVDVGLEQIPGTVPPGWVGRLLGLFYSHVAVYRYERDADFGSPFGHGWIGGAPGL
jgi:hypothetical protein